MPETEVNTDSQLFLIEDDVIENPAHVRLHRKLVESAYKWVLKNCSCGVAFKELVTNACNGECPDVIGFGAWGHSVLIECKTSRQDFKADAKKMAGLDILKIFGRRGFTKKKKPWIVR